MASRHIPLRRRDGSVRAYAHVDEADYEWLGQFRWHLTYYGYVATRAPDRRIIYMHRLILGLRQGDPRQGEHENRDPLDNRRTNLRIASLADNQQNRAAEKRNLTGLRGVGFHRATGRFKARVTLDGKDNHLGYFDNPEQAAAAASDFRAEHMPFSEDARLRAGHNAGR
jgi:hypothetical protein